MNVIAISLLALLLTLAPASAVERFTYKRGPGALPQKGLTFTIESQELKKKRNARTQPFDIHPGDYVTRYRRPVFNGYRKAR